MSRDTLPGEEWRPVPGWPDYEVSSLGRVWSRPRRKTRGGILKLQKHNGGYWKVVVFRNYVGTTRLVHQLVMEAFVGPCPEGLEVRHDDGNGLNSALSNLFYGTSSQNTLDMVRHGTHNHARKTHCKWGHPFDEANTKVSTANPKWRLCRACAKINYQKQKARTLVA